MKHIFQYVFILILAPQLSLQSFLDYTDNYLYNYPGKQEEINEKLIIHKLDKYLFLYLSPINILLTFFILFTYCYSSKISQQPNSKLILIINFFSFLQSLNFLLAGIYDKINSTSIALDNTLCLIQGSLIELLFQLSMMSNFVLMYSLNNKLANQKSANISMYILWIFLITFNVAGLLYYEKIGLSLTGICWIRANSQSLFLYSKSFYIVLYLLALKEFNKRAKQIKNQNHYIRIYLRYLKFYWFFATLTVIFIDISIANSWYIHKPEINFLVTLSNFCQLLMSTCIILLRVFDVERPQSRREVYQRLSGGEFTPENPSQQPLFSLMMGINLFFQYPQNNQFKICKSVINEEMYFEENRDFFCETVIDCELICAKNIERMALELQNSFQINQNIDEISKYQNSLKNLQFLTYDNKFILLSITKKEFCAFKRKMEDFQFFEDDNQNSIINFVVQAFELDIVNTQMHFIIKKNIAFNISNEYILRQYHFSDVLLQNSFQKRQILNQKDFEKFEMSFKIDPNSAILIKQQLIDDACFLEQLEYKEYFLSVLIVELESYCKDHKISIENFLKIGNNKLKSAQSIDNEGIYYFFSIENCFIITSENQKINTEDQQFFNKIGVRYLQG